MIQQAEVTADQRAVHIVPTLVADLGDEAAWRYVEFFTANIRNPNTRRAYLRACNRFLGWCEDRGLMLAAIRPHDVATYIEELQAVVQAPSVKQQLAAIRMLFKWLVTGQVVPNNPAAAVRGPKHVVKTGKTPVLEADAWRKLLKSIPTETLRDLRDRALIAILTYSFARITAAVKMKVKDLRPRGAGWSVRLHEKGGKHHTMPCHPCTRRSFACLHQCGRHHRRPEGLSVPHGARLQRQSAFPKSDVPARRMADDSPARGSGWDR
jgi:site-specific recombinase XerD